MPGKKHKANKSMAQQKMMFILEKEGKLDNGEAIGKARASIGKHLPEHVKPKSKSKKKSRGK